jgi:disulfide bond formation protein DsbB
MRLKQTLTMRQTWIDRFHGEPAAVAALAVFVLSSATLAGAWYFQFVLKILPCPLCLEQRIPYHVVIPLSLLIAIAALAHAPRKLVAVGFIAIIVAVLSGAALAAYHAGVEWRFWAGPTDCSGPLGDLTAGGSLLDQLHSVNVVRCDTASWRFLGISLAGYNVLISLALAAIAAFGLFARKQID